MKKTRPDSKSILSLCDVLVRKRLVSKLAKRENDLRVSILTRPCFCRESISAPRELFPLHVFWPINRLQYPAGEAIAISIKSENPTRILKASIKADAIPDSVRYTSEGLIRGCATEIKRPGPTLSAILGIGGWRGRGFEYYLSLYDGGGNVIRDLTRSVGGAIDSSEYEEDNDEITLSSCSETSYPPTGR